MIFRDAVNVENGKGGTRVDPYDEEATSPTPRGFARQQRRVERHSVGRESHSEVLGG
jgi:hypothetical protein